MIYHLTAFDAQQADPEGDLATALNFMVSRLSKGGKAFVVYADQSRSTTGHAGCFHYERMGDRGTARRLGEIWEARNRMLLDAGAVATLSHQGFECSIESVVTPSHFYGDTPQDIAALCLTGELHQSGEDAFDMEKLRSSIAFVHENASLIGLDQETAEGPRKGMWRSDQPQVATTITRLS